MDALSLLETTLDTPIGEVILLTDKADRLRVVDFADYRHRMLRLLDRHYGASGWAIVGTLRRNSAAEALHAYFAGTIDAIEAVATQSSGTLFQERVWTALRNVPAGRTRSYSEIAAELQQPFAMRAVGLANGANPIAIVVPCHRVVGRSGALTGYGGGIQRKRWLLDHEARHAKPIFSKENIL